jgi:uncharacterized protein
VRVNFGRRKGFVILVSARFISGRYAGWMPFRSALIAYIAEAARPVDKFGHQPRLYALTREVGQGQTYDDDVVFAAVWLHDLGVFAGHRPEQPEELARWDNVAYAMAQAPAVLDRVGFPMGKVAAVVDVIATHQPHATPGSTEGVIVRDSDILEQLGAIGVVRQVSKVGRDTRYPTFTAAVEYLRRQLRDLPGKIELQTARELAKPRIRFLEDFLRILDEEAGPNLH